MKMKLVYWANLDMHDNRWKIKYYVLSTILFSFSIFLFVKALGGMFK
ncbi:MAG: hypothetical protein AABY10_02765 [Nanoarchaeota archaeon]